MSEEHNADEPSETDGSDNPINRRRFVKSLSAGAAGASIFSGVGIGGASAKSYQSEPTLSGTSEAGFEVIDTDLKTDQEAQTLVNSVTEKPEMSDLVDHIEQDSNLVADMSNGLKFDVRTGDNEVNKYEPALGIIPFGRDKDTTRTLPGQTLQDGAGLLFTLTVVEQGRRVPVATFGLTSKPSQASDYSGISTESKDSYGITSYVLDEGIPMKSNQQAVSTRQLNDSPVSTQGLIACSACTTLVGGVCAFGSRIVGMYGCVAACVAAFNVNFVAVYGCSSICSTLFNVIAAVGCGAGGTVICNELSERSPVKFC